MVKSKVTGHFYLLSFLWTFFDVGVIIEEIKEATH